MIGRVTGFFSAVVSGASSFFSAVVSGASSFFWSVPARMGEVYAAYPFRFVFYTGSFFIFLTGGVIVARYHFNLRRVRRRRAFLLEKCGA